jgi:hypothetical protein
MTSPTDCGGPWNRLGKAFPQSPDRLWRLSKKDNRFPQSHPIETGPIVPPDCGKQEDSPGRINGSASARRQSSSKVADGHFRPGAPWGARGAPNKPGAATRSPYASGGKVPWALSLREAEAAECETTC